MPKELNHYRPEGGISRIKMYFKEWLINRVGSPVVWGFAPLSTTDIVSGFV
jgi:hypothetical protein